VRFLSTGAIGGSVAGCFLLGGTGFLLWKLLNSLQNGVKEEMTDNTDDDSGKY